MGHAGVSPRLQGKGNGVWPRPPSHLFIHSANTAWKPAWAGPWAGSGESRDCPIECDVCGRKFSSSHIKSHVNFNNIFNLTPCVNYYYFNMWAI